MKTSDQFSTFLQLHSREMPPHFASPSAVCSHRCCVISWSIWIALVYKLSHLISKDLRNFPLFLCKILPNIKYFLECVLIWLICCLLFKACELHPSLLSSYQGKRNLTALSSSSFETWTRETGGTAYCSFLLLWHSWRQGNGESPGIVVL